MKKRKQEKISATEDEDSADNSSRLLKPSDIKRESKTPQREILSNIKQEFAATKIKNEPRTPKRKKVVENESFDEPYFDINQVETSKSKVNDDLNNSGTDLQKHKKNRKQSQAELKSETNILPNDVRDEPKKKSKKKKKVHDEIEEEHPQTNSLTLNNSQVADNSSFVENNQKKEKRKKRKNPPVDASILQGSNTTLRYTEFDSSSIKHSSTIQYDSQKSLDNSLQHSHQDDENLMQSIEDKIRKDSENVSHKKEPKEILASIFPNSKPIDVPFELKFSKKDRIHLLRIPKCVDPLNLLNAQIELDGGKIKINKEKYVFESTEITPYPSLVIGSNSRVLRLKSNIFMKKYIKPVKVPELLVPEKQTVPLPANLKERHPLFGSNFEEKITLPEDIEQKLNDAVARSIKQTAKLHRKKLKNKSHKEKESNEVIFDLLNAHQGSTSTITNEKGDEVYDSAYLSPGKHSKHKLLQETIKSIKEEVMSGYDSEGSKSVKKEKKKKNKEVVDNSEVSVRNKQSKDDTMSKLLKDIKQELFDSHCASVKPEKVKNNKKLLANI